MTLASEKRRPGLDRKTPMSRKPRPRKCSVCRETFTPTRMGQKVCCAVPCGVTHAKRQAQKAEDKARRDRKAKTRAELEALKPPGQRLREATKRAQIAFNAFIRERDHAQPCISCGTTNPGGDARGGVWDCGHYRSTGAAPELRFEELNAAKQCVKCNRERSGNVVEYRIRLRERIGDEALEWLEGPHDPKRYTVDDLNTLAADYRRRTREMKKARGA